MVRILTSTVSSAPPSMISPTRGVLNAARSSAAPMMIKRQPALIGCGDVWGLDLSSVQQDQVRLGAQQGYLSARPLQQQRIPEGQRQIPQVGADRPAGAPDAEDGHAVLLTKVRRSQRLAEQWRTRRQDRLSDRHRLRFQGGGLPIGRGQEFQTRVDIARLEFVQLAFEEEDITCAQNRCGGWRRDEMPLTLQGHQVDTVASREGDSAPDVLSSRLEPAGTRARNNRSSSR